MLQILIIITPAENFGFLKISRTKKSHAGVNEA